jgi:hypothetical protein
MVVPVAVSVGGTALGVSVAGRGLAISVAGRVVGEGEVCVPESTAGVREGGTTVPCPLHATRNNTNKDINRFMD